LAALERANDLIQRQGKALEAQRTINEGVEREIALVDARFTAALTVIRALINTHPDNEALRSSWEQIASSEVAKTALHEEPNKDSDHLQIWHKTWHAT